MTSYEFYLSPFSWRYSSPEMRSLWSETQKRLHWRQIWLALAEVEMELNLVSPEQVVDLRDHVEDVDIERALVIEAEINHDLMAELKAYAEQCPIGGKILHLGATSMDIEDNADAIRLRKSIEIILNKLDHLLVQLANQVERWVDLPVIAYTHLQPAEPTTLGYRLAQYAQDLCLDHKALHQVWLELRGKGFRGAVGTGASFAELVGADRLADFQERLSRKVGIEFYPVTTQTYPRKQDYQVLSALAGLGGSLYKFAFDLRLLQSPALGELSEPFGRQQVGSSAMPFKRNPVSAENIDSLARALAQMPRLAWDNAAHSLLERTLDDKGNRRILLPEACLITDELLHVTTKIVEGLQVDEYAIQRNFAIYAPFAATERVLMALSKAGADRQAMHERLRQLAMQAWETIRIGQSNPIIQLVCSDQVFLGYLNQSALQALMDASSYVGDAPTRARALVEQIRRQCA